MGRTAKVYLVGAGPGDPDLLTCKALRLLQQADAIVYDRFVSAEILALANPAATLIYGGKRHGQQEEVQNEVFDWLLRLAASARIVVRLKSGDPMVFGRGGEELAFLAEHSLAALDWSAYQRVDTLIILMGADNRDVIAPTLIEQGRPPDHPIAFIENASTGREHIVDSMLAAVDAGRVDVEAPAVIMIGDVVRYRLRLRARVAEGAVA